MGVSSDCLPGSGRTLRVLSSVLVLLMLVLAAAAGLLALPAVTSGQSNEVQLSPGQSYSNSLLCEASPANPFDVYQSASASGDAAAWTSPTHYDCGTLAPSQQVTFDFTVDVPSDASPGTYTLVWTETCQGTGGQPCQPATLSVTFDVVGVTTTTPPSTTTTAENCSQGEHLGGIPGSSNSFICVPDGLQPVDGGAPSSVPIGAGQYVATQGGSVVDVSCPSTSGACPTGPYSAYLGSDTQAAVDDSPCSDITSCVTTAAQFMGQFNTYCQSNAGCSQAWDYVSNFKDYVDSATEFLTRYESDGLVSPQGAVVVLANGWAYNRFQQATDDYMKEFTAQVFTVTGGGSDPQIAIYAGSNGTTVYDWAGQVYLESFATNSTVTLSQGQMLYVPANPAQASQQNLQSSITSFNTNSASLQWWSPNPGPNPYGAVLGLVILAGVVILVVGVAKKVRGRKRFPPPPPGYPPPLSNLN